MSIVIESKLQGVTDRANMASLASSSSLSTLYAASARVTAEEIRCLPKGRQVYERRSGLFFLASREEALQRAEAVMQAVDEMDEASDELNRTETR